MLLFVIGIEFPYAKIRSIGKVAVGVGTIGLFSTLGVVFYTATALGLQFMDALFIAAALSISSTAIIVKILEEMGRIKKRIVHFGFGYSHCRRRYCSYLDFIFTICCFSWNSFY